MDAAYFGLTRDPFARNPDADEACLPPSRAKLVGELLAGSRGRGPTGAVVGDPGAGKSTLAAVLAARIGRERRVALAPAFSAELDEVVGRIVADRVIIIDDAHLLEASALEALCATRTEHLILIGRGPLAEKLRSLSGRIPVHAYRLPPLSRNEAAEYLARRVAAAGGKADTLFLDAARSRLLDASHGLASVLESVAAECLRRAQQAGLRQVGIEIVERALAHAESAEEPAERLVARRQLDPLPPQEPPPARPRRRRPSPWLEPNPPERTGRPAWWIVGSGFAVLAILGLWKGLTGPGDPPPAPIPRPSPIHQPVARSDTVEAAAPPTTLPPIDASETPASAPPSPPAPAARPPAAPPAVRREPASRTSPQWVVQVGAFRSQANANIALGGLRRVDPDAVIERRKGLHFVVSRPFGSEAEAAAFERRLKAAGMSTHVRERHDR